MRKDLENAVYEELMAELEGISKMELGKDEHTKTAQVFNTMIDRVHESKKLENEAFRLELEEQKLKIEEERNRHEKFNDVVKHVITGVTFVGTIAVTVWANIDSKKFEMGYNHTTEAGRASTKKLLGFLDRFK